MGVNRVTRHVFRVKNKDYCLWSLVPCHWLLVSDRWMLDARYLCFGLLTGASNQMPVTSDQRRSVMANSECRILTSAIRLVSTIIDEW